MIHLPKDEKEKLLSEVDNFKACCRFLKVKEKYLYEVVFGKEVAHYTWEVFRTMFITNPDCLFRHANLYKIMKKHHNKYLKTINADIGLYL